MFSSPSNTRTQKSSAFTPRGFSQSLRGAGAGPAGGVSVLRLHRARRGASAQAASRSWLQLHVRRFPERDQMSGHRSFAVLRARTRGQWRRRALHPNLEGELALGAARSKPSRNCAPSSSHSPGATMKLGSSRGMDTKRPRGSERSKPCHQLRLTRRSLPPYPWPPEQAQPGVSKPCRTTGAVTLVNGIGTLRNRLSNSHGRGGKPVRPSPRHASLAVNLAGGVATFLVETFLARQESKGP